MHGSEKKLVGGRIVAPEAMKIICICRINWRLSGDRIFGYLRGTMNYRIELHEIENRACEKCTADDRKERTENHLCTMVNSVADGLPVRCVGEWAYEKIYRLVQYFSCER
jgi:hypothetical protein